MHNEWVKEKDPMTQLGNKEVEEPEAKVVELKGNLQ